MLRGCLRLQIFGFVTPAWDWCERAADTLGRMMYAATGGTKQPLAI